MDKDFYRLYEKCGLCPRNCGVNRLESSFGFCREKSDMKIAAAVLHMGEEPPLTAGGGSGTVFFSGCTLHCQYCQNYQISHDNVGANVTEDEFAEIMLTLQKKGASNINMVTGTHFTPSIIHSLEIAKKSGLTIPIIWNTSGYEKIETIDLIKDWVDIFLPDLKTSDKNHAEYFFKAVDYPEHANKAVLHMAETKKMAWENDLLKTGTIVRHLVIPGKLGMTLDFLKWFSLSIKNKALLSLMTQYVPNKNSDIRETVSENETNALTDFLDELQIEEGFFQDLNFEDDWMPDFLKTNPFPEKFSTPVWHYKTGFVEK